MCDSQCESCNCNNETDAGAPVEVPSQQQQTLGEVLDEFRIGITECTLILQQLYADHMKLRAEWDAFLKALDPESNTEPAVQATDVLFKAGDGT